MAESTAAEITASTSKYISQMTATINNLGIDVDLTGLTDGQVLSYLASADKLHAASIVKPTNYLYVGKNGNDTTGDGSANKPFATISAAITAASSGTTLFIFPGTYAEDITLKAGVNLTSPVKFGVYITGNHVASFTGTVVIDGGITLQSTTGNTLTFSGATAQNLQILGGSSINATAGDAINYTNTNASSKIYFEDGTSNITTSGASARCIYTSATSAGSIIANRVSFKLSDNLDNVCISLNGAVAFTHTSDAIQGQVTMADTSSATIGMVALTTSTVPVLVTSSTGASIFADVIISTTSSPAISGAGVHTFMAVLYASTGVGGAATLNGGLGPISLPMGSVKLRTATLVPDGQVSAGQNSGAIEFDGTYFYITAGTTRKKITTEAV